MNGWVCVSECVSKYVRVCVCVCLSDRVSEYTCI